MRESTEDMKFPNHHYVIDVQDFPNLKPFFEYYRGMRNGYYVDFFLGNGHIDNSGVWKSAGGNSNFQADDTNDKLAEHVGYEICNYLGLTTQEDLKKYFWDKPILIKYNW